MPFAEGPSLAYSGRGRYRTVGPTEYVGAAQVLRVPPDFVTDLASVPRLFWALLPPQGAYEDAAVLHDWCCVELTRQRTTGAPAPVSGRDADGLFRRVMREAGVGPVTRWCMWAGVRWGALANPARRAGWWRDSLAVLAITGLILLTALAVGAAFGVGTYLLLDRWGVQF